MESLITGTKDHTHERERDLGLARWLSQWIKALAPKVEELSLSGLPGWKERIDSYRLSSDLHMDTMVYVCKCVHTR